MCRAAAVVALGVLVGFATVLLAWATEDTSPGEVASSRVIRDARAPSTTTSLPPTTTSPPPTTVAPAPPEPAPEDLEQEAPEAPAPVVPPIAPSTAPAPEPEPAPAAESLPAAIAPSGCAGIGGGSMLDLHRHVRCANGAGDIGGDGGMNGNAQFSAERLKNSGACNNLFHSPELGSWYRGAAGENLFCVFSSGGCAYDNGLAMNQWMQSPGHRNNILNANYHWIGVGVACDGTHTYYVVQFRA